MSDVPAGQSYIIWGLGAAQLLFMGVAAGLWQAIRAARQDATAEIGVAKADTAKIAEGVRAELLHSQGAAAEALRSMGAVLETRLKEGREDRHELRQHIEDYHKIDIEQHESILRAVADLPMKIATMLGTRREHGD
jgi:hypothetical protein